MKLFFQFYVQKSVLDALLHAFYSKNAVMKTILIFILTYFPLLVFSQATANAGLYPLIEEGDKLIQQGQLDLAISLGQKTLKDFPSKGRPSSNLI